MCKMWFHHIRIHSKTFDRFNSSRSHQNPSEMLFLFDREKISYFHILGFVKTWHFHQSFQTSASLWYSNQTCINLNRQKQISSPPLQKVQHMRSHETRCTKCTQENVYCDLNLNASTILLQNATTSSIIHKTVRLSYWKYSIFHRRKRKKRSHDHG